MKLLIASVLFIFVMSTSLVQVKATSSSKNPRVTIEMPLGKLEGEERKSLNGKKFYAFEGVPFAEPPTGNNRFRPPQELKKWSGTKVVNDQGIQCIQLSEFSSPMPPYKVMGDEDCLIMNMYTSNVSQAANLDVILFIHAGAFQNGAGYAFGPKYLLDHDVVYVNFNHRLGPLGFLSTEDDVVPGNMGLLDQIMAMKFVKKYIKYWGGNPDAITLVGDSSGGFCVHFHLLSPLSEGLFVRAASLSGTMLTPSALTENPREKTEKVIALLNCSRDSMQESIKCMQKKPVKDVVQTIAEFLPFMYNPPAPFGIVVDSWAKNPVLPEHPLKLIRKGQVKKMPWILSHTNTEGLLPACYFYYEQILDQIDSEWNDIMPHVLEYNYTVKPELRDNVSQQIRKYYLGDQKVSKKSFLSFVQAITDRTYTGDIIKTINNHLEYVPDSSIQYYFFTYRGAESQCNKRTSTHEDFGASHIDDATYIFDSIFSDTSTTSQDRDMIKLMVKMVLSFARNGTADVGMEWPKVTKEKFNMLHIAGPKNLTIGTEVFTNASFWKSLPIMENERLIDSE